MLVVPSGRLVGFTRDDRIHAGAVRPRRLADDLGDSAIVEVYGLGARAVEASPLSVPSVGLAARDAS
jgi:hypothetical protein